MELKDKTLEEIKEELSSKDFLWIKGDQMGNSEKYENIELDDATGMTFVLFKSGRRMNIELLNEYMDSFPAVPVDIAELPPASPQISSSAEVAKKIPNNRARVEKNSVSSVEVEDSPIYTLLKKQKSNWVNVSINLKLNLPAKSLYSVLISSFDDAEKEIIDYVTEGIDIEDIREALSESIVSYYDKKKTAKNITEENESE